MAVGVNNFERFKKDALAMSANSANTERLAWAQIFFSILTQCAAEAAFPSYNVVLAFWSLYCVIGGGYQATQAYLVFLGLSIVLDVVFCAVWGTNSTKVFASTTSRFCLVMLIFNLVIKTLALHYFMRFYKELEAGLAKSALGHQSRAAMREEKRRMGGKEKRYDTPFSDEEDGDDESERGRSRSPKRNKNGSKKNKRKDRLALLSPASDGSNADFELSPRKA